MMRRTCWRMRSTWGSLGAERSVAAVLANAAAATEVEVEAAAAPPLATQQAVCPRAYLLSSTSHPLLSSCQSSSVVLC
jgi:hypothetical protein